MKSMDIIITCYFKIFINRVLYYGNNPHHIEHIKRAIKILEENKTKTSLNEKLKKDLLKELKTLTARGF